MPEQATYKGRHFVLSHRQVDQVIPGMTERTRIKILIPGKKGRASYTVQKGEDLLVFHPLASHVIAHVSHGHAPMPHALALTVNDIFVQNVHAAVGPTTYAATWSSKACRAKRTASAMASWVILPRHSSMMVSHDGLPRQASGDLVEHICHENARPA